MFWETNRQKQRPGKKLLKLVSSALQNYILITRTTTTAENI